MILSSEEKIKRGRELKPIREVAFNIWLKDPTIDAKTLVTLLETAGFDITKIGRSTPHTWIARWRKKKDGVIKPIQNKLQEALKPTWEQIIKAVPDMETLSLLTFQGMMKTVEERDNAIDTLQKENILLQERISQLKQALETATREKNKLMREYNEQLAKKKIGTLTLDTAQHRLVPKT